MTIVKTVAFSGATVLYTVISLLVFPLTATQQVRVHPQLPWCRGSSTLSACSVACKHSRDNCTAATALHAASSYGLA